HDAAVRVIARLTKERDDARDALSKVTVGAGASSGDAMQIDSEGLPEELVAKVDAAQEKLSKSRRKRPIPQDWADSEAIGKFGITTASKPLYPGASSLALDSDGTKAVVGGADGSVGIYSLPDDKITHTFEAGAAVTSAVWYAGQPIVSTSTGTVKIFGDGGETTFTKHAGSANGLALHPCGDILASVGVDKSFVFYDLQAGKAVTQVYTDSELTTAAFHPDGHLFAAGGADGQIKVFHVKTGELAASFQPDGPVLDIKFSENGFWVAAVSEGSSDVAIFDLRKEGVKPINLIPMGGEVNTLDWDYSGQYIAAAGPGGLSVAVYTKSSKSWSNVTSLAVPGAAIAWGPSAKTLAVVDKEGTITVLG
ncbi:Pre-mRNA-processing factor, partial [Lachnellula suecica]